MPDNTLTEAIKEAYASNPSDDVILHTLELYHPDFMDDEGNNVAIYVVRDNADFEAKLEDGAILNGGQYVKFIALGFDLELPAVDTSPLPEITISIDNVSQELIKHLDNAATSQKMIQLTYRPYLASDTSTPQMIPPISLVLSEVNVDMLKISGKARMLDVGNRLFPNKTYSPSIFKGLTR